MNEIEEVVKEFTEADNAIRKIYPKVDPLLVVRLIFDSKEGKQHIYTLETIIKSGQNSGNQRQNSPNYRYGAKFLS
jgi:hypothetical protein